MTWGLWLHRGGATAVVSFSLVWADLQDDPEGLPSDLTDPVTADGTRLGRFAYAAPSLESFIYRTWVENEIWYGLNPGHWTPRNLGDPLLAQYIQHYR